MSPSEFRYRKNPAWNVILEDSVLVLNSGGDEMFAIDVPKKSIGEEIVALWNAKTINPSALSADGRQIFEQLKTAGIIVNAFEKKTLQTVEIRFTGSPDKTLLSHIKGSGFKLTANNPDFIVFIRTNGILLDLVKSPYEKIQIPHLLLDLTFNHSISIGPLVFRGDTACLGCFSGRLAEFWGDAEPPIKPAIQQHPVFIASLLSLELDKIITQTSRELVNTTVAYDFHEHKIRKNKIYKLPLCPVCSIPVENMGAIALPWLQK